MAALNRSLPDRWYIENQYEEVRQYLFDNYGHGTGTFWKDYSYISYVGDRANSHDGVFACHNIATMQQKDATRITIEEFRRATKREEIINNYQIY